MNARLVFDLQVNFQSTATAAVTFGAISLAQEAQGVRPDVTICDDVVTDLGGGTLRRTVKLLYSADFIATYPTLAEKRSVLAGFGINVLNALLPGRVVFDQFASDYEANDCP